MTGTVTTFSNHRSLKHVVLLYISTCGLYFFYWFYKTNQELYLPNPDAIKPIWRTLGLLVPFLNIYLLWKLFSDIKKFADKSGVAAYRYPSLLTLVFLIFSNLYTLPNLYSFLGFSSVLPVLLVQDRLNRYWKIKQPGLPIRTTLSGKEIVLCCLGVFILVMAIIGAGLSATSSSR